MRWAILIAILVGAALFIARLVFWLEILPGTEASENPNGLAWRVAQDDPTRIGVTQPRDFHYYSAFASCNPETGDVSFLFDGFCPGGSESCTASLIADGRQLRFQVRFEDSDSDEFGGFLYVEDADLAEAVAFAARARGELIFVDGKGQAVSLPLRGLQQGFRAFQAACDLPQLPSPPSDHILPSRREGEAK